MRFPDTSLETLQASLTLVEQSEGLGRAEVMHQVVGPAFTRLLQPLYARELDLREVDNIDPLDNLDSAYNFRTSLAKVVKDRIEHAGSPEWIMLSRLHSHREDLFYYESFGNVMNEAINTAIGTPLTVAMHIYREENMRDDEQERAWFTVAFPHEEVIEIMERPSFDKILLHLTKGPNGFLGGESTEFRFWQEFFDFSLNTTEPQRSLEASDAYELKDGKVIGLSSLYHIAAHNRRLEIASKSRLPDHQNGVYEPNNSSGCPVRHQFANETGQRQESLIITSKKFLIRAVRAQASYQDTLSFGPKTDTIG